MKKLFYLFFFLILNACQTEKPIPDYTLTTSASPTDGGKISVSPQSATYKEGETVTITAEPNEHWVFKQWEGDGKGTTNPLQLTMISNLSVIGIFVKKDYPLTIKIEGEGTVEEKIITNPSGREYPHGTTVQLTPKPKEGWVFDSWIGDLSGSESPKNITVDKEKNVTVKFKRKDYLLKIIIEGEGTVEEKIITNPFGREYPFETVVQLTPKPKEGWVFVSWGGDLTGTESTKTIKVDQEKNIIAKFYEINQNFYLNDNGITCMCPNSKPGEKGIINGVIYESVDDNLLRIRKQQGVKMNTLCTSLVTDMVNLFLFDYTFNEPLDNWDVSNVTNMFSMFAYTSFNQPIGNWDVSKVTNMAKMFLNSNFNQPIGNWNVSNVLNMSMMFFKDGGHTFNQPIGNWNVSNVMDMSDMFNSSAFNQSIGDWDVGNVKNMSRMFSGSPFNNTIENWNVSQVTDMSGMFSGTRFNQSIGNWDVSNVTNMSGMFSGSDFNQTINTWDVSNVIDMSAMFYGSLNFDQSIGNWDVSNVKYMGGMFFGSKFNHDIGDWDVKKVINMDLMFYNSRFDKGLEKWNVENVQSMFRMFDGSVFNQKIGNWNVKNVTEMKWMFANSLFNQDISYWCVSKIGIEPTGFATNSKLNEIFKPKWGTCPN